MASKRFEVDIALNASGVAKGANDGEKALKNLEDALEDAGTGGAKDLNKLEDSLKDVQKQSEKAGRSLDDIGSVTGRGMSKASGEISSFKDEAKQNFAEVASSFSGDVDDMVGGVQGLTGGLAAALAPGIGIPIALLGAAASAWYQSWQENEEKVEEEIQNWVDAFVDGQGKINEATIMNGVQEYAKDVDKMAEAQKVVAASGVGMGTVLRALNGDMDASKVVTDTLSAAREELGNKLDRAKNGEGELSAKVLEQNAALGDAIGVWETHNGAMDKAQERYSYVSDAADIYARKLAEQAVTTGTLTGEVDGLGNAIYELPDGKQVVVDAETGQAYEDLEAIQTKTIPDKTVKVKVDTSEWDRWTPQLKTGRVAATLDRPGMTWE